MSNIKRHKSGTSDSFEISGNTIYYSIEFPASFRGIYATDRNNASSVALSALLASHKEEFTKLVQNEMQSFLSAHSNLRIACLSDRLSVYQGTDNSTGFEIHPLEKVKIILGDNLNASVSLLSSFFSSTQKYHSHYIWADDYTAKISIKSCEVQDNSLYITCTGDIRNTPIICMFVISSDGSISCQLPATVKKSKAVEKLWIQDFLESMLVIP